MKIKNYFTFIFVVFFVLAADIKIFADAESQALTDEAKTVLEEAIKKLQDETKKLLDEYSKIQDEIDALKKEIDGMDRDIVSKTDEIKTVEEEIKKLKEKPTKYKVIKGDCLWNISKIEKIYGDPYKWKKIYWANRDKIKNPDLIYPDQVFDIPRGIIGAGPRPTEYEVVPGDCLWKIAGLDKIYGDPYQWPRLYKANKDQITDPKLIYPYQVFDIPR
ncbi:MAG: LysM peptidoglycan-binding domain-containing protein [bacterium]